MKDLDMAYICLNMGWDYWTFMKQPVFFIDIIREILKKQSKKK